MEERNSSALEVPKPEPQPQVPVITSMPRQRRRVHGEGKRREQKREYVSKHLLESGYPKLYHLRTKSPTHHPPDEISQYIYSEESFSKLAKTKYPPLAYPSLEPPRDRIWKIRESTSPSIPLETRKVWGETIEGE